MIYMIFSSEGILEDNEVKIVYASTSVKKAKVVFAALPDDIEYLLVSAEENARIDLDTWVVNLREKAMMQRGSSNKGKKIIYGPGVLQDGTMPERMR